MWNVKVPAVYGIVVLDRERVEERTADDRIGRVWCLATSVRVTGPPEAGRRQQPQSPQRTTHWVIEKMFGRDRDTLEHLLAQDVDVSDYVLYSRFDRNRRVEHQRKGAR